MPEAPKTKTPQDGPGGPDPLPVHFFTIVLNGEPFIRYHIDVFRELRCDWHWHVIEGVAALVHDTAWSAAAGGHIASAAHDRGRSNDGTSEYLDALSREHPRQVTVYRKPLDVFWNGKREMVAAPLENLPDQCLLWQVDADELWTKTAIERVRALFLANPDRTAAHYWCDYFVGDNLVVATRYCYSQNPAREWLRTWRYRRGARWARHEPPVLVAGDAGGVERDLGQVRPFLHDDLERHGATFQHFAYVTESQLRFKETYYGYRGALEHWQALQRFEGARARLGDYFAWVDDDTMVERIEDRGIVPLAFRDADGVWAFRRPAEAVPSDAQYRILVDAVFFQLLRGGIGRVWRALFEEWVKGTFGQNVVVLDRAGTAPRIAGLRYRRIPAFSAAATGADTEMLQRICDEEAADLFVSTYYTCPTTTPSAMLHHDMIPEMMGLPVTDQTWREKQYGIRHAALHLAVSNSTARDLAKLYPDISLADIRVVHNGVAGVFAPVPPEAVAAFRDARRIRSPYFMLVGERIGYGGYKNCELFFRAFSEFADRSKYEILCVGGRPELENEFHEYAARAKINVLSLSDAELAAAYSGAAALVYPSRYEGFGMPVAEAMACGCPVITCRNSSLVEVAGDVALFVDEDDVAGLTRALGEILDPELRADLVRRGREQAAQFSWSAMAEGVAATLLDGLERLRRGALPPPSPVWRILREMQRQFQEAATGSTRSRHFVSNDPVLAQLDAIDSINVESATAAELRTYLMAARAALAGIQNSPFWRLRRLVLRGLRPLGFRRGM